MHTRKHAASHAGLPLPALVAQNAADLQVANADRVIEHTSLKLSRVRVFHMKHGM